MVPSMNCNWLACHLHYIHNITYNTGASLSARTVRMRNAAMEPRWTGTWGPDARVWRWQVWPHDPQRGPLTGAEHSPACSRDGTFGGRKEARGVRGVVMREGNPRPSASRYQWKRPEASSAKWGGTKGVSLSMEKARGLLGAMGRHEGRRVEAGAVPRHEDVLHPGPLSWGDE